MKEHPGDFKIFSMKKAIIINIGSELFQGTYINLNLSEIAKILSEKGVEVEKNLVLKDDIESVSAEIRDNLEQYDLVIITGGLGPTHDDITREAVAKALDLNLIYSEKLYNKLREKFKRYEIPETETLKKYAFLIEGSETIDNPVGIAPGFIISSENTTVLLLPGPPEEAIGTLKEFLNRYELAETEYSYFIRTFGLKENEIMERCSEELLLVTSGLYPDIRGVDIHLKSKNKELIERAFVNISQKLGDYIYTTSYKNIEEIIGEKLRRLNRTLSVAESCTGGLLGNLITNISGSSDYFMGGIVCYSNEAKINILKVPKEVLLEKGAVSKECAFYMAKNVKVLFNSDYGVGITGIAGPTGGTPQKPVGLVYIAITDDKNNTFVFENRFSGRRTDIKQKSALKALYLLNLILDGQAFPENKIEL